MPVALTSILFARMHVCAVRSVALIAVTARRQTSVERSRAMMALSVCWRCLRFYLRRWAARSAELYADRIADHGARPPFRRLTLENLIRTWRGFPKNSETIHCWRSPCSNTRSARNG